uniref:Myosin light chain kinase, smooth muscle-like n=1 Tax=Oncorhynchus mykiss TaxID=8022 RepID=A0A8C7STJ2_ONCMY
QLNSLLNCCATCLMRCSIAFSAVYQAVSTFGRLLMTIGSIRAWRSLVTVTKRVNHSLSLPLPGPLLEFLDPQEQLEVRVGGQARLHCAFRSCSVPVASCWIYNRETRVESSDTDSSVEISQACPDDAGTYTILVRNRRGLAQHTVTLSVIDRPHPPASSPMVSQLSSCSLVLSWSGPSYDGGTAVTGYVVEVRREGTEKPEDWTEVTTRCKNTSYRIRSVLEPLGEYRFRVRAYNLAGVSEPSEVSDCIKMDTRGEPKEESQSYVTVTIDTTHKVKDHYNVHEKLGVGKFGQVFRLSHKETGQVCAGKFYRAHSSKAKAVARREIELMNCLHHPKLVQCLGAYDTRSEIIMVMEYIAGGELFERIADDNFEHTEPTSARYMHQLLEGMQYIHRQNIVHLDLKPENIVCVDTTGTRIKIIDFGLAAKLEPGTPLMVMHGTPDFVAPEVISYEPVGLATDMWSIGVICFILLSGELPFQGNSDAETLSLVTAARYEFDQESFEDISDQAKDFITSLLKKDTRCRLLCDEALAHPWMASFTLLCFAFLMLNRPLKNSTLHGSVLLFTNHCWKMTVLFSLSPPPHPEASWSPAAEQAIQTLDQELQSEPRFQQVLRDTSQPRGSSARLACRVQGYPEPEVVWFKDEETVESSSRVTMEYDGMCELVLTDLGPADTGVYKCRATNDLGEALCSAKLTVEL